jgi:recombination protein RecA
MSEDKAEFKVEKSEKEIALESTLKEIEKKYGKGSIMKYGDSPSLDVEAEPTGVISLDLALGVRGLPKGRIVELFGTEGGGKTTLALLVGGEIQKRGGNVAFIDVEHAFDPTWAAKLGVDVNNLFISQPDSCEHALNITEGLIRGGAVNLVIIDSVAALVPKAELEGEMGAITVGLQARLMGQALRKLAGIVSKTKSIIIFINQLRDEINTFGYGPKESTPGGRALKFYSSIRLDVRRVGSIKEGEAIHIGNQVKIKVVKNKVSAPFKETVVDLYFANGISKEGSILDLGVQLEVMSKKGSYFYFKEVVKENEGKEMIIGSSKINAIQFLKSNIEVKEKILKEIYTKLSWK